MQKRTTIAFSEENKIELHSHARKCVCRLAGTKKNSRYRVKTVKLRCSSLIVWNYIKNNSARKMIKHQWNIEHWKKYMNLKRFHLLPDIAEREIFKYDRSSCHELHAINKFFNDEDIVDVLMKTFWISVMSSYVVLRL